MPWLLPMMRTNKSTTSRWMENQSDQKQSQLRSLMKQISSISILKLQKFGMTKTTKKDFARQVWNSNSIRMAKLKENQSRFQPQQTGKLTLRIFQIKTVTASSIPTLLKKWKFRLIIRSIQKKLALQMEKPPSPTSALLRQRRLQSRKSGMMHKTKMVFAHLPSKFTSWQMEQRCKHLTWLVKEMNGLIPSQTYPSIKTAKKLSTQWLRTKWTIIPLRLMEQRLPILTNQVRRALLLRKTGMMPTTKMVFVQNQSRFNCMLVIKRLVRRLNCQQITNGPIPSQT